MACPPTPAIISGQAAGFKLARFDPKDKERLYELIAESKATHPSKFGCPGNPDKDIAKKDTTHTEHRIYVVKEDVAGIIGYCKAAISKDVYIAADEKRVKLVYIESSCSFTTSLRLVGEKTVRDIIGDKGGPRVGRYIKEAIAQELCMEYGVDVVFLISEYVKNSLEAHLKNGARKFDDRSVGYLNSLKTGEGINAIANIGKTHFFNDSEEYEQDEVKMMLLTSCIFVAYPPPPDGGRRRKTRRKTKKRRSTRRR